MTTKYNTKEEYEVAKDEMFKNIKKCIKECLDDDFEYNFMSRLKSGLTPRNEMSIEYVIEEELNKFTKNQDKDYSCQLAWTIVHSINGMISSLNKLDKLDEFTKEEIIDLIYSTIEYPLSEDGNMINDLVEYPIDD